MWSGFRSKVTEKVKGVLNRNTSKNVVGKLTSGKNGNDTTTSSSSSSTSGLPQKAQSALHQTSHVVKKTASTAFQKSKSTFRDAVASTNGQVTDKIQNVAQSLTKDVAYRIRQQKNQILPNVKQQLSNQVQNVTKSVNETSQKATQSLKQSSQQASASLKQSSQQASKSLKQSSQQASKSLKQSSQQASESTKRRMFGWWNTAKTTRDRALRWFWWWSLAAIGIYGFATTLPKELIRYTFERKGKNSAAPQISNNDDSNKNSSNTTKVSPQEQQEQQQSTSTGISRWKIWRKQSPPVPNTNNDNATTNDEINKWRWLMPWKKKTDETSSSSSSSGSDRWWA